MDSVVCDVGNVTAIIYSEDVFPLLNQILEYFFIHSAAEHIMHYAEVVE